MAGRLAGWPAGWLAAWLPGCLAAGWPAGWLAGWLAGWAVGWLVGGLSSWLTGLVRRGSKSQTIRNHGTTHSKKGILRNTLLHHDELIKIIEALGSIWTTWKTISIQSRSSKFADKPKNKFWEPPFVSVDILELSL